jgi:hypothetical protein
MDARRTAYLAAGLILIISGVPLCQAQQPLQPVVSAAPLEQAVLVAWDSLAENSSGHPFSGYRLYRARLLEGPYAAIREWRKSSWTTPVRSFLDVGDDNNDGVIAPTEGLRNELTYFYYLSAFADSVIDPYRPSSETPSETLLVIPRTAPTNYSANPISPGGQTGVQGQIQKPKIIVINKGNFRRLFQGHQLRVTVTTLSTGTEYVIPITIKDDLKSYISTYVLTPGCQIMGDSARPGLREGTFHAANVFTMNAFDVQLGWRFEQLASRLRLDTVVIDNQNSLADTPVFFKDTVARPLVGLGGTSNMLGESRYELEFLPGGVDTVNLQAKQIFNYMNVKITEITGSRELTPGVVNSITSTLPFNNWSVSRYAYNLKGNPNVGIVKLSANRYYYTTALDSSASWEFSNVLGVEDSRVVFDYADKGRALGRNWPRAGYKATKDFAVGDRVQILVLGGARGPFPYQAVFPYRVDTAEVVSPTSEAMNQIRIVPNPYLIHNEAQASVYDPKLRFDYLPEECEIKIYTIALDLVKTIHHQGGAVEYWNLQNEAGTRVGSQLLIARIEAPGGATAVKKFSVVLGNGP